MSTTQSPPSAQSSPSQAQINPRLLEQLQQLRNLPDSLPDRPGIYSFLGFTLEPHNISHYGLKQKALDHELQLVFGSRAAGSVIEFRGRGGSLEAIVHTFYKCIDGESGDNQVLWKWVEALTHAALEASQTALSAPKSKARTKRRGRKSARVPTFKPSASKIKAAKAKSAIRYPHNPADLKDDPIDAEPLQGHVGVSFSTSSLFRVTRLSIPCIYEFNVVGLAHSVCCSGLDEALRTKAKQRGAALSLASKLQVATDDNDLSSILAIGETQIERNTRINHALLKWLCDRMVPPSAVDCYRWKELVNVLDPNTNTASRTTIANTFVTTKAAYVHQKSVEYLSQQE
ncbi:hypothetical protein FRC12_010765 [Ceratobasidium sp. 428]|nr:hypothetical protein FRC12_010765 [Ceratobasidium sp. 428]